MIVEALFARRFPAGATGLRGIYAAQRSKNDGREHPFVVCQGLGELASFHHRPGISARERGMDGSHVFKTNSAWLDILRAKGGSWAWTAGSNTPLY